VQQALVKMTSREPSDGRVHAILRVEEDDTLRAALLHTLKERAIVSIRLGTVGKDSGRELFGVAQQDAVVTAKAQRNKS